MITRIKRLLFTDEDTEIQGTPKANNYQATKLDSQLSVWTIESPTVHITLLVPRDCKEIEVLLGYFSEGTMGPLSCHFPEGNNKSKKELATEQFLSIRAICSRKKK